MTTDRNVMADVLTFDYNGVYREVLVVTMMATHLTGKQLNHTDECEPYRTFRREKMTNVQRQS